MFRGLRGEVPHFARDAVAYLSVSFTSGLCSDCWAMLLGIFQTLRWATFLPYRKVFFFFNVLILRYWGWSSHMLVKRSTPELHTQPFWGLPSKCLGHLSSWDFRRAHQTLKTFLREGVDLAFKPSLLRKLPGSVRSPSHLSLLGLLSAS